MKSLFVRICNMLLILGFLMAYQIQLNSWKKEEEISRLNAELTYLQSVHGTSEESKAEMNYKDGTYTGEALGFGGMILVEVQVKDKKITDIQIKSADKEDTAYLEMAKDIIPKIIEEQTTEVDTISGATFSSTGIRDAVSVALERAK